MSATGLEVFDKTIQTTNIWLDELMAEIGPDRHVAWHVLGVVLRALRDRVPLELSSHFAAQLPLIVRGAYFEQWRVLQEPLRLRSQEEFLAFVQQGLRDTRPVDPREGVVAVFNVLSRHLPRGQCEKMCEALPADIQELWNIDEALSHSIEEQAALGREALRDFARRTYEQRRAAGQA